MPLSAKERVVLAFRHKEADRIPVYGEARNIGFIERMAGRKLAGTQAEMELITADACARAGVDLVRKLMVPRWDRVRAGAFEVQWDGYLNWKVGGDRLLSLEESVEFIKSLYDEKGFDPKQAARRQLDEVNRIQGMLGERILFMPTVSASCLEPMYHTAGFENFSVIMYENGQLIDEAIERNAERTLAMLEVILDEYDGPLVHCCDDLGMKGSTLLSPDWMRRHLFGRMKRVIDRVHAGGKYFGFHTCGNVTKIIPDLIEAGIDSLDPIEPTAGMDLAEVKRLYGERLVIMGNADANVIQMGSTDDARREVRRCLDSAARGGGYMLNGGITQAAPAENVLAYFDEARRYTGWRRN